MSRTFIVRRVYRAIVITLVVALIGALIPPESWGLLLTANVAYAAPALNRSTPVARQMPQASQATNALIRALPNEVAINFDKALPVSNLPHTATSSAVPASANATLPALSISRIQSAYTPDQIISNILVITFTVTNNQPPTIVPQLPAGATLTDTVTAWQSVNLLNDPNAIRNVLLVDSLATGTDVVSSAPRADYRNGQYAWNLGDIAPLGSITITLVLRIPASSGAIDLDTGATAWGTLQDRAVSAQACPIALLSDTVEGQSASDYLKSTLDASSRDEYVVKRAGQMCPNPATKSFEYVRSLGYEAYKGSLRGARGTEWSAAGNSLDKSSLLIALLRSNGIPARYRHGTLSDERAQELILSMFPSKPRVVGYIPSSATVADPIHDPKLLAEAKDHWWVESYQNGAWVAMDPSFSYATSGQTFTTPDGDPLTEVPDNMRHKVTVTLKTERFDPLTYLYARFVYTTPLTYIFNTAELVGQPLTFKQLVSGQNPPSGCLIYCWTHFTYIPFLRVGDNSWIIQGHPYWELLSDYPFGQFVVTAEWLIFDVRDADGNVTTYTREIADRVGIAARKGPLINNMVPDLLTANVIQSFGPHTPSLVNAWDSHTLYFNPSWMSKAYAAHVSENMLAVSPRILSVQPIIAGLGSLNAALQGQTPDLLPKMEIITEVGLDSVQSFNRMQGAAFVTFSDQASRELADTGLVRAYPDSPRIAIVSSVISPTAVFSEAVQLEMMDLLHDSLRTIAYPGQVKNAEPTYRLTRGVNEAFLEKMIGEQMTGETGKSGAGVLQAAAAQNIPLMVVDMEHLEALAKAPISQQAKARIVDAVTRGYAVLVPEQMVTWNGRPTIAWWQVDLKTGEATDVSEDGTHQFIVQFIGEVQLQLAYYQGTLQVAKLLTRIALWNKAVEVTWNYYWQQVSAYRATGLTGDAPYVEAMRQTKEHMAYVNSVSIPLGLQVSIILWILMA
jgi:transglutaminase-like putative cysteine protease